MKVSIDEVRAVRESEGVDLFTARRTVVIRTLKRRIEAADSERAFKDILIDLLDEVVLK